MQVKAARKHVDKIDPLTHSVGFYDGSKSDFISPKSDCNSGKYLQDASKGISEKEMKSPVYCPYKGHVVKLLLYPYYFTI